MMHINMRDEKVKLLLAAVLIIITILIIYVPYIAHGGFVIDDWGVVQVAKVHSGFIQTFQGWFPLFSNRPLAPVVLTITSMLFGQWATGYIILNLLFWFSTIFITAFVLRKYLSTTVLLLFCAFAAFPTISSTVIFSPAMQMVAVFSMFLWSLSFYFMDKYLDINKFRYYILTYLVLSIALLIYEIIFPLIIIIALLPLVKFYQKEDISKGKILSYFTKFLLPLMALFTIYVLLQKFILPKYTIVYSRLNLGSISQIKYALHSWLIVFLKSFPKFICTALPHLGSKIYSRLDMIAVVFLNFISFSLLIPKTIKDHTNRMKNFTITVLFLCTSLSLYLIEGTSENFRLIIFINLMIYAFVTYSFPTTDFLKSLNNRMFLAITISFFSSSILYLLSNSVADIRGYDNRGLSSTWFLFALLLAVLGEKLIKSKVKLYWFIPVISSLVCLSFIVQTDNYIKSSNVQRYIVNDCVNKMMHEPLEKNSKIIVMGNVPRYLPSNFNNEEVFVNFWDFGYALFLKSKGKILGGIPVTKVKIENNQVIVRNNKLSVDGYWEADISDLWYYAYNIETHKSRLEKVTTRNHLIKIIQEIDK